MEVNNLDRLIREQEGSLSLAFPALIQKVYVRTTLALVLTGITAYGVASSPSLMMTIFQTPVTMWGLIIVELAIVIAMSAAISRLFLTTAALFFMLCSVLDGTTFSLIFAMCTISSITNAFFIAAGTSGVMTTYSYFTRHDLSSWDKLLLVALIRLIITALVSVFLARNSGSDLIPSYADVLIFVGLTAYNTQKTKQVLAIQTDMGEGAQKVTPLGALSLYLDFINLFLHLLQIFGRREQRQ